MKWEGDSYTVTVKDNTVTVELKLPAIAPYQALQLSNALVLAAQEIIYDGPRRQKGVTAD